MKTFRNLSIKKRLLLIIMSINIFALIVTFFGFMTYDYLLFRKNAVRDLTVMADVIGYNCVAALIFEDAADATKHSLLPGRGQVDCRGLDFHEKRENSGPIYSGE